MFPTPRRALFTTAAKMDSAGGRGKLGFGQDVSRWTGELIVHAEYVTTSPLLLSSSPGNVDMMDMSPLPHKAPFTVQIEVPSPSPVTSPSPTDDLMVDSPVPRQTSQEPPKAVVAE